MSLLSAENIHKSYSINSKFIHVLRGINFFVNNGEIVIIEGPSGAGKSTLLHILGFLDEPTKGSVFFEGKLIRKRQNRRKANLRGKEIGFVFQFYNLLADFNIFENVCLSAMIKERRFIIGKKLKSRAEDVLELVGLKDRLWHRPGELSGGEQQRAAIARAVINQPKILLADEPTGNLDSAATEKIWELFIKLNKELGQTIVIVTHNEGLAKRGTRRVYLQDGVIR